MSRIKKPVCAHSITGASRLFLLLRKWVHGGCLYGTRTKSLSWDLILIIDESFVVTAFETAPAECSNSRGEQYVL